VITCIINNNNNKLFIYLFTCKRNSPEANYKASTRRKNIHIQTKKQKHYNVNNNSVIYLRVELNSRWPITESAQNIENKQNTHKAGKTKRKKDQTILYKIYFKVIPVTGRGGP
jgi:hypothetical protein